MAKTGKDREGSYHPPKGMPSGEGHTKGITEIKTNVNYDNIDVDDPEDLPGDVRIRHPNRNVDKRETRSGKKDATAFRKDHAAATTAGVTQNGYVAQEIDTMDMEAFRELAHHTAPVCVTIYVPTHAAGVAVNEKMDTIIFKNALQQAAAKLKTAGTGETTIQHILAPAYAFLQEDAFWNNQQLGLAVFLTDGFCRFTRMPFTPDEHVHCNKSFYLSPLIPWVVSSEKFYLLVLSKSRAQAYRGDAFSMRPVSIPELPNGIDDVVHFEEKDDQNLFRTGSSGAGKGANYHGMGAGKPDEKQNIQMYLEEVDRTLWTELLNRQNCPLVLAGVSYLLPLFKETTQYKNVWPAVLTGSLEHADIPSLYKAAREILEPYFQERKEYALEQYRNKSTTPLTSSIPEDIIPAAHYGRVSTLFIVKGQSLWGTFDEQSNQLSLHDVQGEKDEPLIDKTVIKTLLNGGDVFEVDASLLPEGAQMAALMRY